MVVTFANVYFHCLAKQAMSQVLPPKTISVIIAENTTHSPLGGITVTILDLNKKENMLLFVCSAGTGGRTYFGLSRLVILKRDTQKFAHSFTRKTRRARLDGQTKID